MLSYVYLHPLSAAGYHPGSQYGFHAHQAGHIMGSRSGKDLFDRAFLLNVPIDQHGHSFSKKQHFLPMMGHKHGGLPGNQHSATEFF